MNIISSVVLFTSFICIQFLIMFSIKFLSLFIIMTDNWLLTIIALAIMWELCLSFIVLKLNKTISLLRCTIFSFIGGIIYISVLSKNEETIYMLGEWLVFHLIIMSISIQFLKTYRKQSKQVL